MSLQFESRSFRVLTDGPEFAQRFIMNRRGYGFAFRAFSFRFARIGEVGELRAAGASL